MELNRKVTAVAVIVVAQVLVLGKVVALKDMVAMAKAVSIVIFLIVLPTLHAEIQSSLGRKKFSTHHILIPSCSVHTFAYFRSWRRRWLRALLKLLLLFHFFIGFFINVSIFLFLDLLVL